MSALSPTIQPQSGEVVSRLAHTQETAGSIPASAKFASPAKNAPRGFHSSTPGATSGADGYAFPSAPQREALEAFYQSIPAAQRDEVFRWMHDGISTVEAARRCLEKFKVKVSPGRLSALYLRYGMAAIRDDDAANPARVKRPVFLSRFEEAIKAASPEPPRRPWWMRLLASLRITPKISRSENGSVKVGAEIKGGFKF